MSRLLLPLSLFMLLLSCKEDRPVGIYEHGKIEYRITYLNEEEVNFDPALLPKKMVLEFNSEFCTNTIDGFMGFFRLGNATYFDDKKSITTLKVLDKSYVLYGERNELMCCFDMFENMKFEFDTTTKMIAGLKSRHAKAIIPQTDYRFDIFYTYDIKLEHPNVTNPYHKLDGVLMDFVLFMGPYRMRFEAKKFTPEKMPSESILIPSKAKEVSRQEMIYALERLMEQ